MVDDLTRLTLREAYQVTKKDDPQDIPWIVRFFENPDSPLSFPGQMYLREHDFLHIMLDKDFSSTSEAFLVGFSMGLDRRTKNIHLKIITLISLILYPKEYRFGSMDAAMLERGFYVAREPKFKSIDRFDFDPYLDMNVLKLRQKYSLDIGN